MRRSTALLSIVGLLATLSPAGAPVAFAQAGKPPGAALVVAALGPGTTPAMDADQNKRFDDLDQVLAASAPGAPVDVIVTFVRAVDDTEFAALLSLAGESAARYRYFAVPGMALRLQAAAVGTLAASPLVKQVEIDRPAEAFMGTARAWFGVDKAVTDFGVTGNLDGSLTTYTKNDIVIAVIDTGVDAAHVDLDGGKVIGWKDLVLGKATPYDDNGHGTHVAGIAAGSGDGSSSLRGVAYGAAVVGVKVLDSAGSGSMSTVDAGIDWVVTNKATYAIDILNLSLGTSGSSDGTDSTSTRVNNAAANGIVPAVAAGNSGPKASSIGSPGAARDAVTVGAMADVGEKGFSLASFSSRGPTADGRTKPDIAAPGVNIMAAKANSGNGYVSFNGTSMATPFVAGVAGLMQAISYQSVATVKANLMNTAQDWRNAGADIDYGAGRLQAYEAIRVQGGRTGTNVTTPAHFARTETLAGTGKNDYYSLGVTSTAYPIALTLIIPGASASRDFDLYLYAPSGALVGSSESTTRQETIQYTPTATGTYRIRVLSYAGSGTYYLDTSAGSGAPTITTDQ